MPTPPPRRPGQLKGITPELYEALLAAARTHPANYLRMAKAAGCTWRTAKRAWERGWVPQVPYAKPIKFALEEEAEAIRTARIAAELKAQKDDEDRRVSARVDAIQARTEEAEGAKAQRRNAIGLAVLSNKLLTAALKMADEVNRRVADPVQLGAMPLKEMRPMLDMVSRAVARAQMSFRYAVEVERIIAGEPIAVIGVRTDRMTPEQLVTSLEGMARTLARAGKLNATDFDNPLLSDVMPGLGGTGADKPS
jgi:hypothetical protein